MSSVSEEPNNEDEQGRFCRTVDMIIEAVGTVLHGLLDAL